uniref:Uncharacterized protein n=1 Tax=Ascaris lumbricoides TaxID=6252 RepID=A0A0M3ITP7_ASCLU
MVNFLSLCDVDYVDQYTFAFTKKVYYSKVNEKKCW